MSDPVAQRYDGGCGVVDTVSTAFEIVLACLRICISDWPVQRVVRSVGAAWAEKLNLRRRFAILEMMTLDARGSALNAATQKLLALHSKLSPSGDVVSEASKKITMEVFGKYLTPREVVGTICQEVQDKGLPSLLEFTRHLDRCEITESTLRVSPEELRQAHAQADPAYLNTIGNIRRNIEAFQQQILLTDVSFQRSPGIELRQRYLPMRRIGVCVPGGAAAYPSSLLMSAVPAQVAGVPEIAVIAPPTKFGSYNKDLLAACHEIGITEVYRVGGAQGVAALAYGVSGIPAVDKIVGPGNQFVALAKRHVYGTVDIDSIAGPSEVVVIADDSAQPQWVALDLIAQAEHYPGSAILLTWSESLAEQVMNHLEQACRDLERGHLAIKCLEEFSAIVVVDDWQCAARLTNQLAPEHLHIQTTEDDALVHQIHNAGAIFLGHFTPVAVGDYVAGPSHVLPTGATARWASGLCCNDYLKTNSITRYNKEGLQTDAADLLLLSTKEGLTGHRESVAARLQ